MRALANDADPVKQTAAKYGLALAQMRSGAFDASMQNLLGLQFDYPANSPSPTQKLSYILKRRATKMPATF